MVDTVKQRLGLAIALMFVVLIIVGGFGRPSSTDAAWSDDQKGQAAFQAGALEITNFQCHSSGGRFLDRNEVLLTWDEIPEIPGYEVEYHVSWDDRALFGRDGHHSSERPEYSYKSTRLLRVYEDVKFTIHAELKNTEWLSQPVSTSASGWLRVDFGCD